MTEAGDYGQRVCTGCDATVQVCVLIVSTDDGRPRYDSITVDPDEVGKQAATVVRLAVRTDRVWLVAPVERLALLPATLASVTRAYFRAHVCPAVPDQWVEGRVTAGAAA